MAFLGGALLLLALTSESSFAQSRAAGVVMTISGQVHVERSGSNIALTSGSIVNAGDTVVTSTDGSVGITLKDDTLLSLGPNSVFTLVVYEMDPIAQNFSLIGAIMEGTLVVTTGEIGEIAPENVIFETPFGVIGIRGTRFAISVS